MHFKFKNHLEDHKSLFAYKVKHGDMSTVGQTLHECTFYTTDVKELSFNISTAKTYETS